VQALAPKVLNTARAALFPKHFLEKRREELQQELNPQIQGKAIQFLLTVSLKGSSFQQERVRTSPALKFVG